VTIILYSDELEEFRKYNQLNIYIDIKENYKLHYKHIELLVNKYGLGYQ